jgi:hypothetical protein
MASGGPSQATGAYHYDGGDRSGPVPDTAPTADGGMGGQHKTTFAGSAPTSTQGMGPCGKPLADTVPNANEWMGLREIPFAGAAPSSDGGMNRLCKTGHGMANTSTPGVGPCGKPPADTARNANEWMGPREIPLTGAAPSSD